ncbi:phosphoglycerate kinase [Verrucomicrobiales bacterium BCK34]|nr:phosphoglycerate kinase [Verrucomicrobiales bacterium BCK34]
MKLSIRNIEPAGKRVLMRVDFNVPQDKDGNITDESRILGAIPSIEHLTNAGGRVILMSHLGRPDGEKNLTYSLKPVAERLGELISANVKFVGDCVGAEADAAVADLKDGEVLLLENVRFYAGETDNDPEFAKQLGAHGDIFVNDAFGTAHRAHASTAGVTDYIDVCAMGFLIEKELEYLVTKLEDPQRPFVVIMGGAKVSDKIQILERLMEKADAFIIGGAMANTFRLAQGYEMGKSFAERKEEALEMARGILKTAEENNTPFYLPADTRHTHDFADDAPTECTGIWGEEGTAVPADREGIDIGDVAIKEFEKVIAGAGTVIWNGPMGVFEKRGFDIGTKAVGAAIAANEKAITIVGGGDSVTAANQFGFGEKMDHMSTGGGASLELLEGKDLPGIAALDDA